MNRVTPGLRPVVTIDGPAGSGKSTTAKEVARRLGFRHLDSGALYRAITYALLESGRPPEVWDALTGRDLTDLGVELGATESGFALSLDGRDLAAELRESRVTERVSRAASLPPVRAWLLGFQRRAGEQGGLVADGRDMGTEVFPNADLKVFLVADLRERARRRLMQDAGVIATDSAIDDEARRIQDRDRQDSTRDLSPLRRPDDAVEMDTTVLTFDEQVSAIVSLVEALTLR